MGGEYDTSSNSGSSGSTAEGRMRRLSSDSSSSNGKKPDVSDIPDEAALETPAQRKARIRSLYIVHFGMFIFMLGYSIILTGVYPYMEQLLPSEDEESLVTKYGWVVSSNPLGQLIMSPILGWASNKMGGRIGPACMFTSGTYILGNALYAVLSLFPESSRYGLLMLSRFIVGASSANAAPMRSYVSSATFQHERTFHMSILSAAQSLGMIVGPSFQAALTPIQCSETALNAGPNDTYLALDMYTACGWISVLMGCASMVLYSPIVFKEFDVASGERQRAMARFNALESAGGLPPPDYLVVYSSVFCFFCYYFNFVIIETLGTPMTMDEFAWTEADAVLYLGIAMTCGGALSLAMFIAIGRLAKIYDERKLIIVCGIIPMMIGRALMMPWPSGPDIKYIEDDEDDTTTLATTLPVHIPMGGGAAFGGDEPLYFRPHNGKGPAHEHPSFLDILSYYSEVGYRNVDCDDGDDPTGCKHDWCKDQPGVYMAQFFTAFFINFLAYPFCISICTSTFSKALGPRPQGLWMGLLTASGSFARVMGPIMVSYVYDAEGVYLTFGIILITMAMALVITIALYPRMVPFKIPDLPNDAEGGSKAAEAAGEKDHDSD